MPNNQLIEFAYATGYTLTVDLYLEDTDTLTSSVSAVEATNRKGIYAAAFTDETAARYRFIVKLGTNPVYTDTVELEAQTAVYLGTGESRNLLSLLKTIHANTAG